MAGVTPSREAQTLTFASREELRAWLSQNCRTSGGVWLADRLHKNLRPMEPDQKD